MKICIVSLQYSPVFKSHCCAMGRQCGILGHSVVYLLNHEYEWMMDDDTKDKSFFAGTSHDPRSTITDGIDLELRNRIRDFLRKEKPDIIYLMNIQPLVNACIGDVAREFGGTVVQHIHEPFTTDKSAYGRFQGSWLHVFEFLQGRILKRTDTVVLSSSEAWRLFERRYPTYNGRRLLIPLMYEDLGKNRRTITEKGFVTFIGPPVPAKGSETFAAILDLAEKEYPHVRFQMITRDGASVARFRNRRNLTVFSKKRISDKEFGERLMMSTLVLAPYESVRQSSTVLTSFMYGIPVVCTDIEGMREFVNHEFSGYLVNKGARAKDWVKGIEYVFAHARRMSENCRLYFEERHSEGNWQSYLREVLRPASDLRILEIGCGDKKAYTESIGLDVRRTPKVEVMSDARRLPFRDCCFDHIYSSHTIEHIPHREVQQTLREWARVLRAGGTLEIACPDLRARAFLFAMRPTWRDICNIYGNQDYPENYHKSGFSFSMMRRMLIELGIRNIKRTHSGYRGIPFVPDSLHVSGIKSGSRDMRPEDNQR